MYLFKSVDDSMTQNLSDSTNTKESEKQSQRLLCNLVKQIDHSLPIIEKSTQGKDIFLVVGNTGAGKSTLIAHLMGGKLELKSLPTDDASMVQEVVDLVQDANSPAINYPEIGHSMTSKTTYPETFGTDTGLHLCDCPGFDDNRLSMEGIMASLGVELAIKAARSISGIIVVIDYQSLSTDKGESFSKIMEIIGTLLKKSALQTNAINNSLFFVFTKAWKIAHRKIIAVTAEDINSKLSEFINRDNDVLRDNQYFTAAQHMRVVSRLQIMELICSNVNNLIVFDPIESPNREVVTAKIQNSKCDPIPLEHFNFDGHDITSRRARLTEILNSIFLKTNRYLNLYQTKNAEQINLKTVVENYYKHQRVNGDIIQNNTVQISELQQKSKNNVEKREALKSLLLHQIKTYDNLTQQNTAQIENFEEQITKIKSEIESLCKTISQLDTSEKESVYSDSIHNELSSGSIFRTYYLFEYDGEPFEEVDYSTKNPKDKLIIKTNQPVVGKFIAEYQSAVGSGTNTRSCSVTLLVKKRDKFKAIIISKREELSQKEDELQALEREKAKLQLVNSRVQANKMDSKKECESLDHTNSNDTIIHQKTTWLKKQNELKATENTKIQNEIDIINSKIKSVVKKMRIPRYELLKYRYLFSRHLKELFTRIEFNSYVFKELVTKFNSMLGIVAVADLDEIKRQYNLVVQQDYHSMTISQLQLGACINIPDVPIAIAQEAKKMDCIELNLYECPLTEDIYLDFLHPTFLNMSNLKRLVLPYNIKLQRERLNELLFKGIEVIPNSGTLSALSCTTLVIRNPQQSGYIIGSDTTLQTGFSALVPSQNLPNFILQLQKNFEAHVWGNFSTSYKVLFQHTISQYPAEIILNAYKMIINSPAQLNLNIVQYLMSHANNLPIFKFPYTLACIAWKDGSFDKAVIKDIVYAGLKRIAENFIDDHQSVAIYKLLLHSALRKRMISEKDSLVLDSIAENKTTFAQIEFVNLQAQTQWFQEQLNFQAAEIKQNQDNMLLLAREMLTNREAIRTHTHRLDRLSENMQTSDMKLNFLAGEVLINKRNIRQVAGQVQLNQQNINLVANSVTNLKDAMIRQKKRALVFGFAKAALSLIGGAAIGSIIESVCDLSDLSEVGAGLLELSVIDAEELLEIGIDAIQNSGNQNWFAGKISQKLLYEIGLNPDEFMDAWANTALALKSTPRIQLEESAVPSSPTPTPELTLTLT